MQKEQPAWSSDNDDSLLKSDIPKLSEENREFCEGKITTEGCFNILKTMKLNKSPGNDGLSIKFYMTF